MSRQEEILAFIACHIAEKGYSPTVREIGKAVGLKSSSTVSGHIERLEDKGLIRHSPMSARSIVIVNPVEQTVENPEVKVLISRKGKPTLIEYKDRIFTYFPSANR